MTVKHIFQTEHPHIVKVKGVCGGKPIIKNTRITVRHIAVMFKSGDNPDEILQAYPHLTATQVYDAISYYLDHQEEIEIEIKENQIENVLKKHRAVMDEKGIVHFPMQQKDGN